jgi:hypothetical protein
MPQPYDYFGLMGGAANIGGVNENIQRTLLNGQSIQQNDNVLAEARRADEARKAMSELVLGGGSPQAGAPAPLPGNISGYGGGTFDVGPDGKMVQVTPLGQDGAGPTAFERLARANPQAAAALQAQMQQRQAVSSYFQNPTAKGTFELLTRFPDLKEQVSKGWEIYDGAGKQAKLNATADAYAYLQAGDASGAIKIVREHMDADKAAGLDINGYQEMIDTIQQNPKAGLAMVGLMLGAGAGPEKFAEAFGKVSENQRANEVQPFKVRQEAATASTKETEAQFAPQNAQSALDSAAAQRQRWAAQTANEVADLSLKRDGLTLERDKLESGIQLELEKLDRTGTQLDAGARQNVNTAVGESVSAQALASRMNDLAAQMATSDASSGWKSRFLESAKGAFGGQDAISGLRAEYNQLVNAQAVKNLPPGPASDKDIALAKQGFPPDSANPQYLASFLRGMAKMQQAVGASADRRANWISSNGSLAPVRRDTDVGGVMVPAGTTFNEFNGNAVKRARQGEAPAGLTSIYQKYGR